MIRRNTWIALVLLAGLIAFAYYYKNQKALNAMEELAPSADQPALLFTAEEGQASSIKVVASAGGIVELGRDDQGQWVLKSPQDAPADQGLAEAAASQVSTLRILDEVDLAPDLIGLSQPAYVMSLGFTAGSKHSLEVGDKTPSESGYYVRVDGGRTVILSAPGLEALINLVDFPPYAATPTPLPATATPAATASPLP